jgi:hypothetical protein
MSVLHVTFKNIPFLNNAIDSNYFYKIKEKKINLLLFRNYFLQI